MSVTRCAPLNSALGPPTSCAVSSIENPKFTDVVDEPWQQGLYVIIVPISAYSHIAKVYLIYCMSFPVTSEKLIKDSNTLFCC